MDKPTSERGERRFLPGLKTGVSHAATPMTAGWPKFADMNWLRLLEGPGNLTVVPVAPTMTRITYKGERYFRMPDSRSAIRPGEDAEGLTGHGGAYLWDGWWENMLQKARAGKIEAHP